MKNKKYISHMIITCCIVLLFVTGCKSESDSYLQFMQRQGVTDNSQSHWQNSNFESVQISSNVAFVCGVKDEYDKTLYQLKNGSYKKISDEAYDFFEFDGKVYYFNSEYKVCCYDMGTESTTVIFSAPMGIQWISLYNGKILCARLNEKFNYVLELYDLNGICKKTYFERKGIITRAAWIGNFVVILEDLTAEVYDLENLKSHYLIKEDGLSDSYMVSDKENLYLSFGRYMIEGNYDTTKSDSQWNGLWKISLSDMEKDEWKMTKISDKSYNKFYCVDGKLYDAKFNLIKLSNS